MSEPFIAEIRPFAFNFNPRGWVFCAGQIVAISEYQSVFALVGTYYGGDGRSSFGIPDLRGRMPVGMGSGGGLTPRPIGMMYGGEQAQLNTLHMASHDHGASFTPSEGSPIEVTTTIAVSTTQASDQTAKNGDYLASGTASGRLDAAIYLDPSEKGSTVSLGGVTSVASGGSTGGTVTIEQNGSGQPLDIVNPSLAINFCMAMNGIFPQRS